MFIEDISDMKILLHACCGPCSLGAIEPLLSDGCSIVLFYYNPCIVDGEYERRLDALSAVAEHYSLPLVALPNAHAQYLSYAMPYASEREGGARCGLCFSDRLRVTAEYAAAHGYDAFSTTLTVSPHKDSRRIFAIADKFSDEFGVSFLARDFKKRDGFLRSVRLSRELGIYRQNFCGCEFSLGGADKSSGMGGGAL